MSVPDSPEELLILEAQTQQERSREVFTKLRQQVTRIELLGTSDASHRSFHVLPGVELDRLALFEDCRQQPGGQVFSFVHVIVNDVTTTNDGDRRLDIREFAVFGGHNAIACTRSTQTFPGRDDPWAPADATGPVLIRLGDGCVRVRRGRQNHLLLPRIRRNLSQSEIVEQRILADDLTAILARLNPVTLEEDFRLAD